MVLSEKELAQEKFEKRRASFKIDQIARKRLQEIANTKIMKKLGKLNKC